MVVIPHKYNLLCWADGNPYEILVSNSQLKLKLSELPQKERVEIVTAN